MIRCSQLNYLIQREGMYRNANSNSRNRSHQEIMVMSMDAANGDQTMASPMDENTNFDQPSRRQESADEELNEDEQSKASAQTIVDKMHNHQQQQPLRKLAPQKKQPDDSSSAMVVSRESSLDDERKLMMHVDDDGGDGDYNARQASNQELTIEEQKAFIEAENKAAEIMKQLKQQSAKQTSIQEVGRKDSLVARMREIVEGTAMQQQQQQQNLQKPKISSGDSLNNPAENNSKASIGGQNQQQSQQQKRSRHTSRTHGCNRHHHHHHHHHRQSVTMLNSGLPAAISSGLGEHQHRTGSIHTHQHGHVHRHHHHHHHHHSHQGARTTDNKRSVSSQVSTTQSNDSKQLQDNIESTMGDKSAEKSVPASDTKSSTSSVSSAPQAPPAPLPATTSGEHQQPTDSGISGEANVESKKAVCPHHQLGGNNGHHHHHHHHHSHQLGQNASQHPHHHHHYHNHPGRHHHHHHRNHKKRLVLDVSDDQQATAGEQHQCLTDQGRLLADAEIERQNSKKLDGESEILAGNDYGTRVEQEDSPETKRAPLQEMNTSNVVDNFCCAHHERNQCSVAQSAGGQLKHHHHHHHHNHGHHHHHHHPLHNQAVEQVQKKDTNFATSNEQQQQQQQQRSSSQHRHHHHRHHHHHNHHHHGHHSKQRHRNKHKTSSNSNINIDQDFQEQQQQSNAKHTSDSTMTNQETYMIKSSGVTEGATTVCDETNVSGREEFDSESKMHLDNEESGDDRTRNTVNEQGRRITEDQYTSSNNKASNEVVTMDMSPNSENKPHRRSDIALGTSNADIMAAATMGDCSGEFNKNKVISLQEAANLGSDESKISLNVTQKQKVEENDIIRKDIDSGGVKQNKKDAIRQPSNNTNYEFARNQEGDSLREVQDNLSRYDSNNSSSNNNKQASDQRLVRQMSRENSQKEVVGAGEGSRRQQSQQPKQLHIECLPETYRQDQQQVSQPKQIIQSTVPPDRRCRLCWCCCCPCSGLSNKSNAIKAEIKPAIEQPSSSTNKCLSVPNVPLEEVRMWGDSFDRLMKCPEGRKIFQDFLRCEYSEENILFWIACEELKSEKDAKSIATKARDIYEDYISILSAKEVSLDSRVRDVINNNIKKPTSNIFDEAQLQIYTLMHRDSYPRFINSAMYKKLAQIQTTSRKGSS